MKLNRRYVFYGLLLLIIVAVVIGYTANGSVDPKKLGTTTEKIEPVTIEIIKPSFITASVTAKKSTQISSGVFTTDYGDNLLVLVNKNIRLPATYEPSDLVSLDGLVPTVRGGMMLRKEAANALAAMSEAAQKKGANLIVLSAYRSYWSQQATFSFWVGSVGLSAAETFSARPGHSQHQLGTTIDFTSEAVNRSLSRDLTATTEGQWVRANAYRFGFVLSYPQGKEAVTGYIYEPWHYRFIGKENARKMVRSGLILEEFLQQQGVI